MILKLQAPDKSVVLLDSRSIVAIEIPVTPIGPPTYFCVRTPYHVYQVQWNAINEVENQLFADNPVPATTVAK